MANVLRAEKRELTQSPLVVAVDSLKLPLTDPVLEFVPMHPRSLIFVILASGVLVVGWLLFARASRPPEKSPPALFPPSAAALPPAVTPTAPPVPASADQLARLQALVAATDARPDEATLIFKDNDTYRRFLARALAAGLTVVGQIDALRTVRVRYDRLASIRDDLLHHSADYADTAANFIFRAPEYPTKADRADLTQIPLGNTSLAFLGANGDRNTWGRGVTIAILDSGVNALDPTFSGRVRTLDVGAGNLPGTENPSGHGTGVAALAAGVSADAPGIAPAANILSIRVTAADGLSDIFTVARGIVAAADAGAQIINISLGGYATTGVLDAAIDYATTRGALIVAAAGNDQATRLTWPAADSRVVSVGAVDALGQQVTFSNSGPQLQVSAPGYGVQTAWLDQQRVTVSGTSASAPLVAGSVAAVMSADPRLTATQAWDILAATTNDAGAPGPDSDYGRGILNVGWALSRNNPARVDPAISSHYFDATNNQMDFVVQNRGAQPVSGLTLDIATNGFTTTQRVVTLAPGASVVLTVPVDQRSLITNGALVYQTTLNTPLGLNDADPSNNQKSSRLTPPKK